MPAIPGSWRRGMVARVSAAPRSARWCTSIASAGLALIQLGENIGEHGGRQGVVRGRTGRERGSSMMASLSKVGERGSRQGGHTADRGWAKPPGLGPR